MRNKNSHQDRDLEGTPAKATAMSGIDRTLESRLYPVLASWIGTKTMQSFFGLQNLFLNTNLGSGILVLAKLK